MVDHFFTLEVEINEIQCFEKKLFTLKLKTHKSIYLFESGAFVGLFYTILFTGITRGFVQLQEV